METTKEDNDEHTRTRRRLSDQERADIVAEVRASIYADIGQGGVRKILWVLWAIFAPVLAWLTGAGHIKIGG